MAKTKNPGAQNDAWENAVDDFLRFYNGTGIIEGGSVSSYKSYLKGFDELVDGPTLQWLYAAASDDNPIDYLMKEFEHIVPKGSPSYDQRKHSMKSIAEFILGYTNANLNVTSIVDFEKTACKLVSQSAIFSGKDVVDDVINGKLGSTKGKGKANPTASWYHCTVRRLSSNDILQEHRIRGEHDENGILLDANNYANTAIKCAVIETLRRRYALPIPKGKINIFSNFEACHIWDKSCYDEKYYTSIPNLVLIPRSIAGLTDHCGAVKDLLKYEAWLRFGFLPANEKKPRKPKNYDTLKWRDEKYR